MTSAGRDPAAGPAPPRDRTRRRPRVVIAAPLYNGGPHVEAALRSLLAQTHADLRLVLVDDASTDGTTATAAAIAAEDPRVELYVNAERLGMLENTRRAWRLARARHREAEFWALGSDHDVWDPRWLETLVGMLDADPGAVLAYPLTDRVDGDGRPIADRPRPWRCETAGLADPRARVRAAYRCMVAGDMIYGLFRAAGAAYERGAARAPRRGPGRRRSSRGRVRGARRRTGPSRRAHQWSRTQVRAAGGVRTGVQGH